MATICHLLHMNVFKTHLPPAEDSASVLGEADWTDSLSLGLDFETKTPMTFVGLLKSTNVLSAKAESSCTCVCLHVRGKALATAIDFEESHSPKAFFNTCVFSIIIHMKQIWLFIIFNALPVFHAKIYDKNRNVDLTLRWEHQTFLGPSKRQVFEI